MHDQPGRLIDRLLAAGFDASRAHSLFVVPPPANRPDLHATMAEEMLPLIVHLPCYAEMPDHELRRLAAEVVRCTSRDSTTAARVKRWSASSGDVRVR
jgi:hypothetical protein